MQPNKSIQWVVRDPIDEAAAQELAGFSPVLRQLMYNRCVRTAPEAARYLSNLPPPAAGLSICSAWSRPSAASSRR